jgi:hypothetical protein
MGTTRNPMSFNAGFMLACKSAVPVEAVMGLEAAARVHESGAMTRAWGGGISKAFR